MRHSSSVTRNGSVTGSRVPSRTISTCGIARSSLEQPAEAVVGEHERVAAGEQHVADLGRRADPVERRLELALLHRPLRLADHALAQAEAAVERALVVHAERDPVAVDADHVLDRRVGDLVERIGEAGRIAELGDAAARPGGGSGTRDRAGSISDA